MNILYFTIQASVCLASHHINASGSVFVCESWTHFTKFSFTRRRSCLLCCHSRLLAGKVCLPELLSDRTDTSQTVSLFLSSVWTSWLTSAPDRLDLCKSSQSVNLEISVTRSATFPEEEEKSTWQTRAGLYKKPGMKKTIPGTRSPHLLLDKRSGGADGSQDETIWACSPHPNKQNKWCFQKSQLNLAFIKQKWPYFRLYRARQWMV